MRSILSYFVMLFVATTALSAEESDPKGLTEHETYIWLEREGIFDPEVPNDRVHELISQGIKHDDPKIVHCSLSAVVWYASLTSHWRVERIERKPPSPDRQLGKIPDLYDLMVGLWEKGWKESDGVVPEAQYPDNHDERMEHRTGCIAPDPIWTSLSLTMASIFPGDEKVYDIIWKDLPQTGPGSLLIGLFEGKFNNPKDQQYRIDFLTDRETELYWSSLAARSLGDFRSEQGLETLATTLEDKKMKWGTPQLVIVEAMMKYEADAAPYISLMRETLDSPIAGVGSQALLKATLKERLVHFEEKYAEEAEQPSR